MVANKYLEELEMSNEVRKELVELCKLFQESSRVLANKYAWRVVEILVTVSALV